jgi:uncharacterized protein (DUF433 family)
MPSKGRNTSPVQETEQPYSVRVRGICGGRPTIKGTRLAVRHIAQR